MIKLLENLKTIYRYRGLIQSLVGRELKARYRGTVLGFLWSFINPLLLMIIYTIVFGFIIGPRDPAFNIIPSYMPSFFSVEYYHGLGFLLPRWKQPMC